LYSIVNYTKTAILIEDNNITLQIEFQSVDTVPVEMRAELRDAKTADVAQAIFQKWEDKGGYVEYRSRGTVWIQASTYP